MICPMCNATIADGSAFCTGCGAKLAAEATATSFTTTTEGVNFDFSNNGSTVSGEKAKKYQYKVLSQKDKWFSGKFDPALLEQAINAYAQQGWRVISCATADIPGFGAARQEFITVLEREI